MSLKATILASLCALLTATATAEGWWLGIAIVVVTMLAGTRWPAAYEPPPSART